MNEVNRITTEVVVEAYKKTGLKPIRSGFLRDSHNRGYSEGDFNEDEIAGACPLGALCLAVTDTKYDFAVVRWSEQTYGAAYIHGFWHGFDNRKDIDLNTERKRIGYEDGQTVYKEMQEAGLI